MELDANEIAAYLAAAEAAGCPQDQIQNFWNARMILQPKQLEASAAARLCDEEIGPDEIGYGGARGGGKSSWVLMQVAGDDCQRQPGLHVLLLRKIGKSARESLNSLRWAVMMGVPHRYSASRGKIDFPNGSWIITGHYNSERDIDYYLGLEYDVIIIEEATTLSFDKVLKIKTVLRTNKPNWRPRLYLTTNPGGIGHAWFKERFILPYRENREVNTRFIQALVTDNAVQNKSYRAVLESMTGWELKAWRYGDWDIQAGQFFSTWRDRINVVVGLGENQIDGYTNPNVWIDERRAKEWFVGFDYGFTHPSVLVLGFYDHEGVCFIVDLHCHRKWLIGQHAPAMKGMLARHRIYSFKGTQENSRPLEFSDLEWAVAGGDIFSIKPNGGTIAKDYESHGIKFKRANDDRINGAASVIEALGDPDDQDRAPVKLYIHKRCVQLIKQIPAMQHDEKNPEDVKKVDVDAQGNGGDDCFVAGTMIQTEHGETPVEMIRPGDLVMTRVGLKPVVDVWLSACGKDRKTLELLLSNGTVLNGTLNHPIWVIGKGFIRLDGLKAGDELYTDSLPVHVEQVRDGNPAVTYAVHVKDQHEYFANGVLVKNCYDALRYGIHFKKFRTMLARVGGT